MRDPSQSRLKNTLKTYLIHSPSTIATPYPFRTPLILSNHNFSPKDGHNHPQPQHSSLPRDDDEHAQRHHHDVGLRHPDQRQGHPPRVRRLQPGRAERGRPRGHDAEARRQSALFHQRTGPGGGRAEGAHYRLGGYRSVRDDHKGEWGV